MVDVAEQYVGPETRARIQESCAHTTQDGIQGARDAFRYLINILTQNISFERDGGPQTANERRKRQHKVIIKKIEGVSNFTVRKERMMRRRPRCLIAQLEQALEKSDSRYEFTTTSFL